MGTESWVARTGVLGREGRTNLGAGALPRRPFIQPRRATS